MVLGNYGSALLKAGQIRQAIDQFEHALAIAPDLSEVWSNYGMALQEEHRMDAALDALLQDALEHVKLDGREVTLNDCLFYSLVKERGAYFPNIHFQHCKSNR